MGCVLANGAVIMVVLNSIHSDNFNIILTVWDPGGRLSTTANVQELIFVGLASAERCSREMYYGLLMSNYPYCVDTYLLHTA
jgi:hypothetical protein